MSNAIPRLAFGELESALADYLKPTVDRLGYFGEFFQTAGHVPDALRLFMDYTKAVKSPLGDNLNEVLALTVCAVLGADYERIQHERLAQRLGFSLDWISAAAGRPDARADCLNGEEAMARTLALAVIADSGRGASELVAETNALLGPQRTMAALLQITRFMTIAFLCNALELELPVKSVFESAGS